MMAYKILDNLVNEDKDLVHEMVKAEFDQPGIWKYLNALNRKLKQLRQLNPEIDLCY